MYKPKEKLIIGKINRPRIFESLEDAKNKLEGGFLAHQKMSGMDIETYVKHNLVTDERTPKDEVEWVEQVKKFF